MSRLRSGPLGAEGRGFATTHWSLVLAIRPGDAGSDVARQALAQLCRAYWYPLYAFVRFRGFPPDEAQDMTQAFFARLIESEGLATVDPERGRFRSYLLGAMKNFLANAWHEDQTQKRGGDVRFIDLDALDPEAQYALAPVATEDPDLGFDREWALAVLDRALERLGEDYARRGRAPIFAELKGTLSGEEPNRDEATDRLGLSPGALKVAVHRLRKRFRAFIREEVAETVENPDDVEAEMRYLIEILRKTG